MDIWSTLILLAATFLISVMISQPLTDQGVKKVVEALPTNQAALLAERERLLDALQELDFDHGLGKIPSDVYSTQRQELVTSAALVLKKIETQGELP